MKNHPDYKEIDQRVASKLAKEVDKHFTTYIYSENSDQVKHGLVLKGLNFQKSLKND